jgi:hypothetical protein
MGGQPGTLMIGLSVITLCTGVARVGFGFAACTQPHDAQLPHDTMALASFATRRSLSTNGFPPGMQYTPSSASGGLPSTARM